MCVYLEWKILTLEEDMSVCDLRVPEALHVILSSGRKNLLLSGRQE